MTNKNINKLRKFHGLKCWMFSFFMAENVEE
jgi:hypothetical protein